MSARRHPSSFRAAGEARLWLWLDILAKLAKMPPLALVFVLALLAVAVVVVVAWWPFVLAALACLIVMRWWRRRGPRPARGRIPFGGRLSLIEWTACRLIEVGEGVLRRRNRRRPS